MNNLKIKTSKFVVNLILIIVSCIMIFPFLIIINVSLKYPSDFLKTPMTIVKTIRLQNFVDAWNQANMIVFFKNSIFFTVITAFFVVIFTVMAAFPIARKHLKSSGFLYTMFISGIFLPGSLVASILIMKYSHLINTYYGVSILFISFGIPLAIFIFTGFIKGIPKELDEAAFIDGCGYIRYIFSILIPLMKTSIATVGLLTSLNVWNDFITPYLYLEDDSKRTLTSGLYSFFSQYSTNWTLLCAAILIIALPMVIAFIFTQKYIISGVMSGSLKG